MCPLLGFPLEFPVTPPKKRGTDSKQHTHTHPSNFPRISSCFFGCPLFSTNQANNTLFFAGVLLPAKLNWVNRGCTGTGGRLSSRSSPRPTAASRTLPRGWTVFFYGMPTQKEKTSPRKGWDFRLLHHGALGRNKEITLLDAKNRKSAPERVGRVSDFGTLPQTNMEAPERTPKCKLSSIYRGLLGDSEGVYHGALGKIRKSRRPGRLF